MKAWVKAAVAAGAAGLLIQGMLIMVPITAVTSIATVFSSEKATSAGNDDCAPADGDAPTGTQTVKVSAEGSSEHRVAQTFADAGFSKAATAGMMGNIYWESGFDQTSTNPSSGAYGLAQWLPKSKLRGFLDSNGMGGVDESDFNGQLRYLLHVAQTGEDWTPSLWKEWKEASDPQKASDAWRNGYERPGANAADEKARRDTSQSYFDSGLDGIEFTGHASDDGGDDSGNLPVCDSDDDTQYGKIGGAPVVSQGDYSWMCDQMHVCSPGDVGPYNYANFPRHGYQCTWYAWTRLAMLYGTKGWTTGTPESFIPIPNANGGDVWAKAQGLAGWTVTQDDPHPGDGASGWATGGIQGAGHIAVVEEVKQDGDSWKVRISEGNLINRARGGVHCAPEWNGCWNGYRGDRWFTEAQIKANGVHFFRYAGWKN